MTYGDPKAEGVKGTHRAYQFATAAVVIGDKKTHSGGYAHNV